MTTETRDEAETLRSVLNQLIGGVAAASKVIEASLNLRDSVGARKGLKALQDIIERAKRRDVA